MMGIVTPGLLSWKKENQHRGKDKAVGNYKEALTLSLKVFPLVTATFGSLEKHSLKEQ